MKKYCKHINYVICVILLAVIITVLPGCGQAELTSGKTTESVSTSIETSQTSSESEITSDSKSSMETSAAESDQDVTGDSSETTSVYSETTAYAADNKAAETAASEFSTEPTGSAEKYQDSDNETTAQTQTTAAANDQNDFTCTITVDGGGTEGIYYSGTVNFDAGDTVYDILVSTGLTLDGNSTYIKAINNLREKEHGPMSGWLYQVNGVTPMKSCGAYKISGGDNIYWYYQYDE